MTPKQHFMPARFQPCFAAVHFFRALVAPLILLLALLAASPARAHDFWISHGDYKSPDGVHCCGDNDCQALSDDQVAITPRGYALINGELVPFSEAQPSEDGHFWRCKRYDGSRRCFFAPQPSS